MKRLSFLLILCFILSACEGRPPIENLSKADEKLVTIIQEELELEPTLIHHPHTIWVYLPVEFEFFKIKLSDQPAVSSDEAQITRSLKYIDVQFRDQRFEIAYDVGKDSQYMKSFGYSNTYTEDFQKTQRTLLTAIPRAYADLKDTAPEFFVIVFANIKEGLKAQVIVSTEDIIRANTDHSFGEEIAKRLIQEMPIGSKEIIGDKYGRRLNDFDLTWPIFLARQMKYRIEFKYTRSFFPPSDDTVMEMLLQARATVNAYDFEDYEGVLLKDLWKETEKFLPKGSF